MGQKNAGPKLSSRGGEREQARSPGNDVIFASASNVERKTRKMKKKEKQGGGDGRQLSSKNTGEN